MPLYETEFLGGAPKKIEKPVEPIVENVEMEPVVEKEPIVENLEKVVEEEPLAEKKPVKRKRAPSKKKKVKFEENAPQQNLNPLPPPPAPVYEPETPLEEPEIIKAKPRKPIVRKKSIVQQNDDEPPEWFKKYVKDKALSKLKKRALEKKNAPVMPPPRPKVPPPSVTPPIAYHQPAPSSPRENMMLRRMNRLYAQIHGRV